MPTSAIPVVAATAGNVDGVGYRRMYASIFRFLYRLILIRGTDPWVCPRFQKSSPTCAICRSKLASTAPMIPNFSMDNTVEKHIHALASSGASEWEEKGSKYVEWEQRKESVNFTTSFLMAIAHDLPQNRRWRNGAKDRMSQIKPKPQLVETDSEGEVYSFGISTESIESIPPPVTRPRRTRQNRGTRRGRHSNRNNDGGGNTPVAGGSRRSSGRHSEGRRR